MVPVYDEFISKDALSLMVITVPICRLQVHDWREICVECLMK